MIDTTFITVILNSIMEFVEIYKMEMLVLGLIVATAWYLYTQKVKMDKVMT